MAPVNFDQLFFTNSMKVKDNKKHHNVHLKFFSKLFSNFPGLNGSKRERPMELCQLKGGPDNRLAN